MGDYWNPPETLPSVARKLDNPTTYENAKSQLKDDECLIGLFDRIMFKNAVHLYSQSEWDEFEKQGLITIGFFALPKDKIPSNWLHKETI